MVSRTRTHQSRRDPRIAQRPCHSHLGKALAPLARYLRQGTKAVCVLGAKEGRVQGFAFCCAGAFGDSAHVAIGQHALGERAEGDGSSPRCCQGVEQTVVFDPSIQQRVGRLVNQQRNAEVGQDFRGSKGACRPVGGNADIQRLALGNGGGQRTHGFFNRRIRVRSVVVEDVDIVQAKPLEALVQAGQHVLARPEIPVGAWPHIPPRLGRDDQFVSIPGKILAQDTSGVDFSRPERWTVIVREIEVGDSQVEGRVHDLSLRGQRFVVAEVMPEPQTDQW